MRTTSVKYKESEIVDSKTEENLVKWKCNSQSFETVGCGHSWCGFYLNLARGLQSCGL